MRQYGETNDSNLPNNNKLLMKGVINLSDNQQVVIIGAGIAGMFAASHLRRKGFDGEITVVDHQDEQPYDRPPLTKEFLRGSADEDEVLLHKPNFYEEKDIQLKLGKYVSEIDADKQVITLAGGELIHWDKLLVTTGSMLNRLDDLDEREFENVFYIRTKEDAVRLKHQLKNIEHLVIFGGGFIGLEVAASLRSLDKKVTILEPSETPLMNVLGSEMGSYLADFHRSQGVEIITGDYAEQYKGEEKVTEITTKQGKKIPCDGILVSIGVTPDLSLVEGLLDCEEDGIIINEYGETSVDNIFAAGDNSRWPDPVSKQLIRVEHWENAFHQGRNVALNIIHEKSKPFDRIPYFWSDQYDLNIEYLGQPLNWDQSIVRGDKENDELVTFYVHQQKLVGALFINRSKDVDPVKKMMGRKFTMTKEELQDTDRELSDFT